MRPDFLEVAKKALAKHYPGAIGGFVAGSMLRGEDTPTSDIDIAVLFDESFEDIHRNSVIEQDWPIEFFVHNRKAQDYFFDKDRQRGMCIMPTIVATGLIIPAETPELLRQKTKAKAIITAGPPRLTKAESDFRRYMMTDLIDDLKGADSDVATRNAALALLHQGLGDFYLRAACYWSGRGKSLLICMRDVDSDFCYRFQTVFADAFAGGPLEPIYALSRDILLPHGGLLWEGYSAPAPDDWKEFEEN